MWGGKSLSCCITQADCPASISPLGCPALNSFLEEVTHDSDIAKCEDSKKPHTVILRYIQGLLEETKLWSHPGIFFFSFKQYTGKFCCFYLQTIPRIWPWPIYPLPHLDYWKSFLTAPCLAHTTATGTLLKPSSDRVFTQKIAMAIALVMSKGTQSPQVTCKEHAV